MKVYKDLIGDLQQYGFYGVRVFRGLGVLNGWWVKGIRV